MKLKLAMLFVLMGAMTFIGCEKKSPAEEAADDIGNALEDAADEVKDAVD